VFYIVTSDKTRLLRQLNRELCPNVDEIIRRYSTDKKDFENLNFSYTVIPNQIYEDLVAGPDTILSMVQS
jgi:hypothetical protein